MLTKVIEEVLLRAMRDTAFADALFANAEKALAGYGLTVEEIARFKGLFSMDPGNIASTEPERDTSDLGRTNHNGTMLKACNSQKT